MLSSIEMIEREDRDRKQRVTWGYYSLAFLSSVLFLTIVYFYSAHVWVGAFLAFGIAAYVAAAILHYYQKPYHFHLMILSSNTLVFFSCVVWGKAFVAEYWIHMLEVAPIAIISRGFGNIRITYSLFTVCVITLISALSIETIPALNHPDIIHWARSLNVLFQLLLGALYLIHSDQVTLQYRKKIRSALRSLKDSFSLIEKQDQLLAQRSQITSLMEVSAGFAHEINNPLAIVSLTAETALSLVNGESFEGESKLILVTVIEKLNRAAERTEAMVNRLCATGSMNTEDQVITCTLEEVKNRAQKFVQELSKSQTQVQWVGFDTISNMLVPNCVNQVLESLLSNSIDAIEQSDVRWIEVSCQIKGKRIYFSVTDSGRGVDPKLRARLFEPFFTTKPLGRGKGLSLATSQGVLRSLGGQLVYSPGRQNTRFVFWLPYVFEDQNSKAA